MRKKIPKNILEKLDDEFKTQRGKYQTLRDSGASINQVADAYQINPRTVWQRTNDRFYRPKEKSKIIKIW